MRTATPQQTYDAIIGSGALSYGWYLGAHTTGKLDALAVADNWVTTVIIGDPEDDLSKTFTVDHFAILAIAGQIAAMRVTGTSTKCDNECHNLCYSPDFADFDANTADEVLQAIVFGCVIYG